MEPFPVVEQFSPVEPLSDVEQLPVAEQFSNVERIPIAWAARMSPETLELAERLSERAAKAREAGENILPPPGHVFRALRLTAPENVRCVILGQDPYPTPGVANGLAFSANPGEKIPASLRNIFKELSEDLGSLTPSGENLTLSGLGSTPSGPDLTPWAETGVLLLNSVLTVRAGESGSHAKWGWQRVTGEILRICTQLPQPIAFLFWGRYAHQIAQTLDFRPPIPDDSGDKAQTRNFSGEKFALYSSHPSPLGARQGNERIPAFLGSRPFSRVNAYLIRAGAAPVDWRLP